MVFYSLPLAVLALVFAGFAAVQQRSVIEAAEAVWFELLAAATIILLIWIPMAYWINRLRSRLAAVAQESPQNINPPAAVKESLPASAPPAKPPAKAVAYVAEIEETTTRRLTMDYVPMLDSALSKLEPNDSDARENVYEHSRKLLVRSLRKVRPILSSAEVLQEKLALEEAIGRVEKSMQVLEAQRKLSA
jgi:hypothetical protein